MLVEGLAEIALQRFEPAGAPHRWVSLLGARREAGADRKDRRPCSERCLRGVADERQDLIDLSFPFEDVDLVDDDDDLLAPGTNRLDEGALGLGEGSIR